jgi:hypothetical protein
VDLRRVNKAFPDKKIKFENLSLLRFTNNQVAWGGKVDMSDAYHHLALHPSLRKFFQFQIDGEYFICIGIPFGWKLAPWIFTKFTRPVGSIFRFPLRAQELGFPGLIGQP